MEHHVHDLVDILIPAVDPIGIIVISIGVLLAFAS